MNHHQILNMPKISVIIPTYNRAWSIIPCLESVATQSFQDFECLIVDDGSTDNTEQLVLGFIKSLEFPPSSSRNPSLVGNHASQYTYLKISNHGVSYARNYGVKHSSSTARYVAFLDSDDQWHPQKLHQQFNYHQDNSFRISQTNETWIRRGVEVTPPKHFQKIEGEQFVANLKNCMISPSSVFMEKSLLAEFDGFNEDYPACEDYDLWIKVTAQYPVGLLRQKYLTKYGGHDDQLSTTSDILDLYRMKAIFNLLKTKKLTVFQIEEALKILRKKYKIVKNGAQKRQNRGVLNKIVPIGDFLEGLAY